MIGNCHIVRLDVRVDPLPDNSTLITMRPMIVCQCGEVRVDPPATWQFPYSWVDWQVW